MKKLILLLCAVIINCTCVFGNGADKVSIKFQVFSVKLNYISDFMTLTFEKGTTPERMFEQGFKQTSFGGDFGAAVKDDVKINKLTVKTDIVEVDFNNAFNKQGYGSGAEGCMLSAVINTLGNYYGVPNVRLTVEGKPYESGHISVNEQNIYPVELFKSVVYSSNARLSGEGLMDDYIYSFSNCTVNPKENEPIFLINGIFAADSDTLVKNGHIMVTEEFLLKNLGAASYWNEKTDEIEVYGYDSTITMKIGEKTTANTAPVVYNGKAYLPLRYIAEQLGYAVGYYNEKPQGKVIAKNPVIWLERVAFNETPEERAGELLPILKDRLYETLENCKAGAVESYYAEYFSESYPKMKPDIEKTAYCGQIGRFVLFKGYRLFLVDMISGEIYYAYNGNAYGGINVLDVNDTSFYDGYFAG